MKFKLGNKFGSKSANDEDKVQPLFGVSLPEDNLPFLVTVGLQLLEERSMDSEGLFRLSGDNSQMQLLKKEFDEGKYATEEATREILSKQKEHTISGMVKMYFRELPEPLLTFDHYDMFIAAHGVPDQETRLVVIKKVLTFLPDHHMVILKVLCKFLNELIKHEDQNKMNSTNLSIVFAPNLLRPQGHQLGLMLSDSAYSTGLMKTLIESYPYLFEGEEFNEEEEPQPQQKDISPTNTERRELPQPPPNRFSIKAMSSPDLATAEIKRLTINLKETPLIFDQDKPMPPPRGVKPTLRPTPNSNMWNNSLMGSAEPTKDPNVRRAGDLAPPPSHKRSQTISSSSTGSLMEKFSNNNNSTQNRTLPSTFTKDFSKRPLPQPKLDSPIDSKKQPPQPPKKPPTIVMAEPNSQEPRPNRALPRPPQRENSIDSGTEFSHVNYSPEIQAQLSPSSKPRPPLPSRTNRSATTFVPPPKDTSSPKNSHS